MISFKSFITAIHNAILSANESLKEQHLELLDTYFERASLEKQIADQDKKETPPENTDQSPSTLKAKSVMIEYPRPTQKGTFDMAKVHVPLITLVPICTTQIDKVKITTDFQIQIVDDELQVNFPKKQSVVEKKGLFGMRKDRPGKDTPGTLEITLKPHEPPEGLAELIEGYEKVLKAQIPH